MKIENSHLIDSSYPFASIFKHINGISADRAGRPMLIAWTLEDAAVQRGWPVGAFLGTERELIAQFGVNRDTLREAIRVVEARGSMQMQRGCAGGLRLLSPPVENVASALAAYLHASGHTQEKLQDAILVAEPIFAAFGDEDLIVSLYRQTVEMLCTNKPPGAASTSRAETIAKRLIESNGPPPASGIFLGDEAQLSDKLGCTRPALREALRILADLSIVKVRRGRGGGFTLVQPSADFIVRRVFGLIASRHFTLPELLPTIWALNLIRYRLAVRNLRLLDDQARRQRCDELISLLDHGAEPARWHYFESAFDRIADNNIISLLHESFTYYLARLNQSSASWGHASARWSEIDATLLATEGALVQALRTGDYMEAERLHLMIHSHISWTLDCPDLPGTEPPP